MANGDSLQTVIRDLFSNLSQPLAEKRRPLQAGFSVIPTTETIEDIGAKLQPEMTDIGLLPKGRIFSTFDKEHMNEAMKVIMLLKKLQTKELENTLAYLRDIINEELFVYATSVFITQFYKGVQLPLIYEVFPSKFIASQVISRAKNMQERPQEKQEPIVIDVNFTGTDQDQEHRLAYWREDIALNAHHWHWHIVYPWNWIPEVGTIKDRKGELFYYMHQQIIARYDCERLSLTFPRVAPLQNWNERIPEGYAPHLTKDYSGIVYAFRPPNMKMTDLPLISINHLQTSYSRIMQDIHKGYLTKEDGTKVEINNEEGIDLLGEVVESASTSVNLTYYGILHNLGHQTIARVHDPDERYKEEAGVMSDIATAMRDPIFYRWHKFIDDIFYEHKRILSPYTVTELTFADIVVKSITVQGKDTKGPNMIKNFWQERTMNLQNGMSFQGDMPILVRIRHLQHESFSWIIEVENTSRYSKQGTVRVFMAPTHDTNREQFSPDNQRRLMIEMDKFEFEFVPGKNIIKRKSEDSNVTIPIERSFGKSHSNPERDATQSYCSCGLPDHLLVPRGKPEGMPFLTFVMVTDALEDRVSIKGKKQCADAASYCGVLNEKYPDKKPMGFPFDRVINAQDWNGFKTPNMGFGDVSVHFREEIVDADDE